MCEPTWRPGKPGGDKSGGPCLHHATRLLCVFSNSEANVPYWGLVLWFISVVTYFRMGGA